MSDYVSSASAGMYIVLKIVARKEFNKCVLFLLGFINIEQKSRFRIITDESYKVKCNTLNLWLDYFFFVPYLESCVPFFFSTLFDTIYRDTLVLWDPS